VLLAVLVVAWLLYGLFGGQLIKAMYEERSVGFLNHLIHGRDIHPFLFYSEMAHEIAVQFSFYVIFVCWAIMLLGFLGRSSNGKAVLFGILWCLVIILSIETVLYVCKAGWEAAILKYPPRYIAMTNYGVAKPTPGRHRVSEAAIKTGRLIYDVECSIDQYGRRITPLAAEGKRDKFILFFGCSFTYGDGVKDDQTLPFYVAERTARYMPYNYGFHGRGPFDILAELENINFQSEVREKNGILIYVFIDDHVHRAIGSSSVWGWKFHGVYYRQAEDGKLVRAGSFLTGKPFLTRIYQILGKSRILRVLKISFPIRIRDPHIKLAASAIWQIKENFNAQYPRGEFYVLIYPSSQFGGRLIDYLKGMGIRYLDYRHLFFNNDPRFRLPEGDDHPSALAHKTIAEKLVEDLELDDAIKMYP